MSSANLLQTCSLCPKKFSSDKQLTKHFNTEHIPPGLNCIYCHSEFTKKSSRVRHEKKCKFRLATTTVASAVEQPVQGVFQSNSVVPFQPLSTGSFTSTIPSTIPFTSQSTFTTVPLTTNIQPNQPIQPIYNVYNYNYNSNNNNNNSNNNNNTDNSVKVTNNMLLMQALEGKSISAEELQELLLKACEQALQSKSNFNFSALGNSLANSLNGKVLVTDTARLTTHWRDKDRNDVLVRDPKSRLLLTKLLEECDNYDSIEQLFLLRKYIDLNFSTIGKTGDRVKIHDDIQSIERMLETKEISPKATLVSSEIAKHARTLTMYESNQAKSLTQFRHFRRTFVDLMIKDILEVICTPYDLGMFIAKSISHSNGKCHDVTCTLNNDSNESTEVEYEQLFELIKTIFTRVLDSTLKPTVDRSKSPRLVDYYTQLEKWCTNALTMDEVEQYEAQILQGIKSKATDLNIMHSTSTYALT